MASFEKIPVELQAHILSFIPPWQLSAPRRVCTHWNKLIRSQLHRISYSILEHRGATSGIHWLLYNNYHCDPNCQTCFEKYENDKERYPTLSSATFKRVYLVGTLDSNARICGYQVWIEKCSSTRGLSPPNIDDFKVIRFTQDDFSEFNIMREPVLRPKMGDTTVDISCQDAPILGIRYFICFPHCTTNFTRNPTSVRRPPTITIASYMTLKSTVESIWVSLKRLCFRYARNNVRTVHQVRLSIAEAYTDEGTQPILRVDLDAEGACCDEIIRKQGEVSNSVFSNRW
ncbi:hypothetical protein TWF970_002698 [Orbilia oligospora]|uniref:F-box domain-containing protein n=1 Tax=Orbilia oligospora TaxID=2813651 RepID=A0A7C8VNZ3_ORBOL|nr:hypothetical protein TWF970_002698 [Orbilia oligospora]